MKIRIKNPIWGVPITFLDNYCPKQFKIVGIACGNTRANTSKETLNKLGYKPSSEDRGGCPMLNGKRKYARILIQKI